jgi:hypothetical protein
MIMLRKTALVNQTERILKQIELFGKLGQGKRELISHLNGNRLTTRQMVLAKCYECSGYLADGREDCEMPDCPLHPLMPYKKGDKYSSSKRSPLSEEQKEKLRAGLAAGRQARKAI